MFGESHAILEEFPGQEEQIVNLMQDNVDFALMVKEHDNLDTAIRELEANNSPTTDEHMEELKHKRAHLKDEIYQSMLAYA